MDLAAPALAGNGEDAGPVSLAPWYRAHGAEWSDAFVRWLGDARIALAGPRWNAFACTAKNMLSSPLGNRFFQVMALRALIAEHPFATLLVAGATPAQARAIAALRSDALAVAGIPAPPRGRAEVWRARARNAALAARLLAEVRSARRRVPKPAAPQLWFFTYYGERVDARTDTFFGPAASLLARISPATRIAFTGFAHGRLDRLAGEIATQDPPRHWPLYLGLRTTDILGALAETNGLAVPDYRRLFGREVFASAPGACGDLLDEAMFHDAASGSVLHHLLIARAAARLGADFPPATLVFPFEAKALEYGLVDGLRSRGPGWHVVGYQHTAITPRHLTFRMVPGEAEALPLPERIVTLGDVTRQMLADAGYPRERLLTGCALRQRPVTGPPDASPPRSPARVLLALSSSRDELVAGVAFVAACLRALPGAFEVGIRPHPEFPLRLLPDDLRAWLATSARDFTGTALRENLDWCDAVAYVSSTVGMEGLMAGKAAIQFSIGDPVEPDPVAAECPHHWRAADPRQFLDILRDIAAMDDPGRRAAVAGAIDYLQRYFVAPTDEALRAFLPGSAGGG